MGLRYTWRFVGVEFDYRCYFSVRGLDNYSEQFSELPREVDYDTHIDHAFRCGVYFLFQTFKLIYYETNEIVVIRFGMFFSV